MITTFVVGTAVLAAVAVVLGPVVANRRFRRSRRPSEEEADRVQSLASWGGLTVDRAYVIETLGNDSVDVAILGPPGRRLLFVTDYVLADLDDGVAAALFAAEAGRAETYYGLFRALAIGTVLGILAATFGGLVPFGPGLVLIVAIGLGAFWIGRRLQYRADRTAARRVGADQLADAFEQIAELRDVEPERGDWQTVFEIQPPLGDRIDRLKKLE